MLKQYAPVMKHFIVLKIAKKLIKNSINVMYKDKEKFLNIVGCVEIDLKTCVISVNRRKSKKNN